jgi:tetratricopeptide (TPR) repeat protein
MTRSADPGAGMPPGLRYLALLLVGALAWAGAVHPGTVNLDTPWMVSENPILSSGELSWIPTILFDMSPGTRVVLSAEYMPVRDLSVLMDFALFGDRWAWHHAHSLALYLLSCLLFLRVFDRIVQDRATAWLGAALFMLHPVHVESVTWLATRKDVLGLFFVGCALLLQLEAPRRLRPWAITLCLILAMWSKNTTIMLPGMLVAVSLIHQRERPTRWSWWTQWVPMGLAAAALFGLAWVVGERIGLFPEVRGGSTGAALLLEARVVFRYLGLALWPRELSVAYAEPAVLPFLHPLSLAACAGVFALLALVPLTARRWPLVSLGLSFFFVGLIPFSQIVPTQNLMADRYLLLPLAGLVLVLCQPIRWLHLRYGRLGLLPGLVLAAALAVATVRQHRVWTSSVALWERAHQRDPDNVEVRCSLAGALEAEGRVREATALLHEGLEQQPDHPALLSSAGVLALEHGRPEQAEQLLRRAWASDDDQRKAAANLLTLLNAQGRSAEAAALGAQLTATHPLYPQGWNNHGAALLALGRLDEAARAFERALEANPFYATAACNRGVVAGRQGRRADVDTWARRCLALDPENETGAALLRTMGASAAP